MNLSEITIIFKSSPDFIKLSIILHALAVYALWGTSGFFLRAGGCVLLLGCFWNVVRKLPQYPYTSLRYYNQKWHLFKHESVTVYETLSLRVDTGLFFVVVLKNARTAKTMVIFRDQLSPVLQRNLWLLERSKVS